LSSIEMFSLDWPSRVAAERIVDRAIECDERERDTREDQHRD